MVPGIVLPYEIFIDHHIGFNFSHNLFDLNIPSISVNSDQQFFWTAEKSAYLLCRLSKVHKYGYLTYFSK